MYLSFLIFEMMLHIYVIMTFVVQILFYKLAWDISQDISSSVQTQFQARDGVHRNSCSGFSFTNVPLRTGTVTKTSPAFKGRAVQESCGCSVVCVFLCFAESV